MNDTNDIIDNFALPLPISEDGRRIARQFAIQQPTLDKAEKVLFNTLAVWVVNDYLQMLGMATILSNSDSWNSIIRLCADVADLEVAGVGKLECRPIKVRQNVCTIPAEVWDDRIGYIVVEIDDSLRKARLLGYTPTASTEILPLNQLQPLEDLIDRLHQLITPVKVNLSQWFDSIFRSGWEAVETLLDPVQVNLAFRGFENEIDLIETSGDIKRGKLINLGQTFVLIVELQAEAGQQIGICLQVYPADNQLYLPLRLKLSVIDDNNTVFMEVQSRNADNYIQLKFSGRQGENFNVLLALGDVSFIEHFMI